MPHDPEDFSCCGGNDEKPVYHCSDCPYFPWENHPMCTKCGEQPANFAGLYCNPCQGKEPMTIAHVNMGSGPLEPGDLALARKAIIEWCREGNFRVFRRLPKEDRDGRFAFRVSHHVHRGKSQRRTKCTHDILMPGVTLSVLQGNVLRAPRLYRDESSWWWAWSFPRCDYEWEEAQKEKKDGR